MAIILVKRRMIKARFMDEKVQGWEFEFALMAGALALLFTGAGSIAFDTIFGL